MKSEANGTNQNLEGEEGRALHHGELLDRNCLTNFIKQYRISLFQLSTLNVPSSWGRTALGHEFHSLLY